MLHNDVADAVGLFSCGKISHLSVFSASTKQYGADELVMSVLCPKYNHWQLFQIFSMCISQADRQEEAVLKCPERGKVRFEAIIPEIHRACLRQELKSSPLCLWRVKHLNGSSSF